MYYYIYGKTVDISIFIWYFLIDMYAGAIVTRELVGTAPGQ